MALLVLAALILWWFGRRLDWAEVRRSVGQADAWRLVAAAICISVAYLWRACRWRALLRPLTDSSLRESFAATTVGFSAVFIFGRAGEVVRPIVLPLRDRRVRPAASFVTIMIERLFDTVTVVLVFAFNLIWFRPPASHAAEFAKVRLVGVGLLLLAALGIAGLMWFRRRSRGAVSWVEKKLAQISFIPQRAAHAVASLLEHLAEALGVLSNARDLAVALGWTALVWFTIGLASWFVLRAFGLPFGAGETAFVLGSEMLGSVVPTPGGAAGGFHAATAAGLVLLGVPLDQAAAIAIIAHPINFAPALIFALYYILRGDINITRLRELSNSEEVEHAVEGEITDSPDAKMTDDFEALAAHE